MQIERLVQMIFYIADRKHVTAKELANRFQVSTRTIYRDIDTLTLSGIPVISAKGTGGGISLIDGYAIDKSLLSEEEQRNIYQGLQILKASKYPNAEAALSKIGAVFKNAAGHKWLEVDFSYWGSDEDTKIHISELQYSIINKHRIAFDYINTDLEKSGKVVEPLRLVFKSHAWYIIGYCLNRNEIRTFRMSRMKQIQIMPETFDRELPQDYSLTPEYKEELDVPLFKLKFDPRIAHRLYDEFQEDQFTICEDGSYLVTVRYQLNTWTFHYLLSFGQYVEILEPETAREMLKEKALEIARIYS